MLGAMEHRRVAREVDAHPIVLEHRCGSALLIAKLLYHAAKIKHIAPCIGCSIELRLGRAQGHEVLFLGLP
eukprot:3150977-Rhodomonas_salina.2